MKGLRNARSSWIDQCGGFSWPTSLMPSRSSRSAMAVSSSPSGRASNARNSSSAGR